MSFSINGPASPVNIQAGVIIIGTLTSSTAGYWGSYGVQAYDGGSLITGAQAVATDYVAKVDGLIVTGAQGGPLALRCKSEVSGSAITVRTGSFGKLTPVS